VGNFRRATVAAPVRPKLKPGDGEGRAGGRRFIGCAGGEASDWPAWAHFLRTAPDRNIDHGPAGVKPPLGDLVIAPDLAATVAAKAIGA
jgi:hypothetical protein